MATVMSNLGLERYLQGQGLTLERTKVGDRYVLEKMKQGGFNIGGAGTFAPISEGNDDAPGAFAAWLASLPDEHFHAATAADVEPSEAQRLFDRCAFEKVDLE